MRPPVRRIAVPLLACALLAPAAAPSPAAADPPPTGGTPAPEPAALVATPHVLVGKVARFRGTLTPDDAGRTVTIERLDAATQAWTPVATAPVQADGSYVARWRADVAGRHQTRATVARAGAAVFSATQPDAAPMTVYRPAVASWYGPGFYGQRTACGQRMTSSLLGVAHKRLPCGAEVALTYRGRSITVPVVDRGPFVNGRRWDLTAATAKALAFSFTDRIGALRIG